MTKFLKLSLFIFILPIFISYSMEKDSEFYNSGPSEELSTAEEIKQRKEHNAKLNEIIKHKINDLLNLEDKDLVGINIKNLNEAIKGIVENFEGKDKEELTKRFKLTLTALLPKLLNSQLQSSKMDLSSSESSCVIDSLFDNTPKFNPSIMLSEFSDKENIDVEITDLPQEIILNILSLANNEFVTTFLSDPSAHTNYSMLNALTVICFKHIKDLTNVCKQFYLTKGILLQDLKEAIEAKLLNKLLRISSLQEYDYIAEILLTSKKVDINEVGFLGTFPLMQAIRSEKGTRVLKLLLQFGANTETTNEFGAPPLIAAISQGKCKLVKLLLDKANCFSTNALGFTPLHIAIENCKKYPNSQTRKKILELVNAKIQQTSEKELEN